MATYQTLPQSDYGSHDWLKREIGGYLGFGYNPSAWDSEKSEKVESIIQSGLSQFYFPPPIPDKDGKAAPHRWSFLAPVAEIELVIDQSAYELPEDFAGILEDMTVGQ